MGPTNPIADDATQRARRVRLVALDVDGTLTDGRLYIGAAGESMKAFCVRDGFGLTLLREAGILLAVVTGRRSTIVDTRAAELGFSDVRQGVTDKAATLLALSEAHGVALADCAFVGDDWPDLAAMAIAGFSATVADAAAAVRERAHWVASVPGGHGAVREFAEFVLHAQGRLSTALSRYTHVAP